MMVQPAMSDDLKTWILRDPDAILEDREIMRALIAAGGGAMGRNVVDLRGVLVDRLEDRLDRLEDTHRSVIAAAYENLAGTNQVHRAVLSILKPSDFRAFLEAVAHEVTGLLALDLVRIAIETPGLSAGTQVGPEGELRGLVVALAPGGVEAYMGAETGVPGRAVLLRQNVAASDTVYGREAHWIRSEAVMKLDLGGGRRPAMLLFAAEDPNRFSPDQGTDLLSFFGGVFENTFRRWLA